MATITLEVHASEALPAASRREMMKREAVRNIHSGTEKIGNAAVDAIEYCKKNEALFEKAGEACGSIGGAALGTAVSAEGGCLPAPIVMPLATGAGKMAGGKAVKCGVDGCHKKVAPKIPGCAQATADCTGMVVERGIDCAADSADSCRQGIGDFRGRYFLENYLNHN